MGLSLGFSKSTADQSGPPALPNPDPKHFQVLRSYFQGGNLVIEVKYLDCTNYEGRKILLYRHISGPAPVQRLIQANGGLLDPHFADSPGFKSPFARFEPTAAGWHVACKLADDPTLGWDAP